MDSKQKVYIIGVYVPNGVAKEAVQERDFFQQLFTKSAEKNNSDIGFQEKLTEELLYLLKKGDVLILLNPSFDPKKSEPKRVYKSRLRKAVEIIGRGRTVLAFQDKEAKRELCIGSCIPSLWEITYAPIYSPSDTQYQTTPAPEEAINIMERILKGENPDVYL